ncbi:MAG: hypothetical protein NXI24_09820 [bacterium]|nr:hypothetical protein [bacterium]
MKAIIQKIATGLMLALLGALAGYALLFAIVPDAIPSAGRALELQRQQNRATLQAVGGQVLRPPPGPAPGTSQNSPASAAAAAAADADADDPAAPKTQDSPASDDAGDVQSK